MFDWESLAEELKDDSEDLIYQKTEVLDGDAPIELSDLFVAVPKWIEYKNVVTVSADLRNSTGILESNILDKSVASILDASVGAVERIFKKLNSDFVDIQGDGAFGLFTGKDRFERALVAAISISTYSKKILEPILTSRWGENKPDTGFKIGVGHGRLLVKQIGTDIKNRSPVWVGTPVNYAVKIGASVGPHEVGIQKSTYEAISNNDYLTFTCGHTSAAEKSTPEEVWKTQIFSQLSEGQNQGFVLKSHWCDSCGPNFIRNILSGETDRNDL